MQCPNCKYKYGWDFKTNKEIRAEAGAFYVLPVKMERESFYGDTKLLCACPKCGATFIDV